MYELLIEKIRTTLEGVVRVKDIFSVPKSKLTTFPCVFFKPYGCTNEFETNAENRAVYEFIMVVMVGCAGITPETAFNSILPKTVDEIIAQFNQEWNQGVISGHRVTARLKSADPWELSEEQDGLIAYAPFILEIRLLTTN